MSISEMRIFDRSSVCCPAHVFVTGAAEAEPSFVTDLSEGGAFVQTRQRLRLGDRLYLRLNLEHEKIADAAGEVAWVRGFEPVSVDGQLPGVGVRFVDLSPDDRLAIRGFVGGASVSPLIVTSLLPQPVDATASMEWHDTDVDEPAPELHRQEELSVGHEPELGELKLEEPRTPVTELRVQRNWTPWLAVGSLALGISAGAVYGMIAPTEGDESVFVTRVNTEPLSAGGPGLLTSTTRVDKRKDAPALAKPVPKPAKTFAIPRSGDNAKGKAQSSARAGTQVAPLAPAATSLGLAGKPTPATVKKAATPRTKSYLSAPQHTPHGWYISLASGGHALNQFALDNPARVVVDMPPGSVTSLTSRDMHSGPFKNLRVGRNSDRTRLVFDLDAVVSPGKVRFVKKGGDLVIELPNAALASR